MDKSRPNQASPRRGLWIIAACMVSILMPWRAVADPASEAPPAPTGTPAPGSLGDYIVRPGDVLKVFVWKEPDLSGEVAVRSDGKFTVPLVGDVLAAGRTPMQIAADVRDALQKFLEVPEVTVAVSQTNSERFFVVGQVAKQGVFPLNVRTTVVQALATAGGFTTFAKRDEIVIIHDRKRPHDFRRVDYKLIESGRASQNFVLEPGDTIVVP